MVLTVEQKDTLLGMLSGLGVALVVIVFGSMFNPFNFGQTLDNNERLRVSISSIALLCLVLTMCIGRLAKHRFFTPADINGSGLTQATARAKILQALLQNTLEQTTIAVIIYNCWAVLMPSEWLSAVPLAALSFVIGRFLFFNGYAKGPAARAFGFALTFYPSVLMLVIIVIQTMTTAYPHIV